MQTIASLLKKALPDLPEAQRKALNSLLPETHAESLEVAARLVDPGGDSHAILNLRTGEDGGQYFLRWNAVDSGRAALIHADTLVLPLPAPADSGFDVSHEIQQRLALQLVNSLAKASDIVLQDDEAESHAEALLEGTTEMPRLRRGILTWFKGLFDRDAQQPSPAVVPGSEHELNRLLLATARTQVNVLSSKEGPDGGNLACVWAVDKIFQIAFGRHLTRTLGTAVIDEELSDGKGRRVSAEDATPGNIIISPTGTGRGHGHIGILGERGVIYSNSSARARWEQNHTLASWKARYVDDKGMALHFYQVRPATAGLRSAVARSLNLTDAVGAVVPVNSQVVAKTRSLNLAASVNEDTEEAAMTGHCQNPPLEAPPSYESSASLYARAREAEHRENLETWMPVSPVRALEYYEILRDRLADDTLGNADGCRSGGGLEAWRELEGTLDVALRWDFARSDGDGATRSPAARRNPPSLDQLRRQYEDLFASCRIRPQHVSTVAWYVNRIRAGADRYKEIGTDLSIPWRFIAVTHSLEASNDFSKHLHNGDPLTGRTVRVPTGRLPHSNPPYTFTQSAHDAMKMKNYHLQSDWSEAAMLYRWEKYNGWGYRSRGIHTPYLWSFSEHYTKGKFVRDGVYDPNAVSRQAGAAVLLKAISSLS